MKFWSVIKIIAHIRDLFKKNNTNKFIQFFTEIIKKLENEIQKIIENPEKNKSIQIVFDSRKKKQKEHGMFFFIFLFIFSFFC